MNHRVASLLCVVAIGASACSADASFSIGGVSVEDAASDLIEGDIAEQIDMELTADCPEVTDAEVGTSFACTATTDGGDVIEFAGEVDREDHIDLQTTNLLSEAVVPAFAQAAADQIEAETGQAAAVDCGTSAVVLDASDEMVCTADIAGETRDLVLTVDDPDSGNFRLRVE